MSVVGHSSGEIAAAFAAGMLSSTTAMTIAYFRGKLCDTLLKNQSQSHQGAMLAVGLTKLQIESHLDGLRSRGVSIACYNSPKSLTLSGKADAIDAFHGRMCQLGHFSRKLKVNVAYHSPQMETIADDYRRILSSHMEHSNLKKRVKFNSSVHPRIQVETNYEYWVQNLLCPVRFSDAMKEMVTEADAALRPNLVLEIGPHSTLAGPIRQTLSEVGIESDLTYLATLRRGSDDVEALLATVCHLFDRGAQVDCDSINFPHKLPSMDVLTDLPSYPWSHGTVHWYEGRQSSNHLHKEFPTHDLLGSLTRDSSTHDMKWINHLSLSQVPWLRDHIVREEVIFPGAGYMAMAIEAARQKAVIRKAPIKGISLRDVSFMNALPIPEKSGATEVALILEPMRFSSSRISDTWDMFRVISYGIGRHAIEHCHGSVSCCQEFKLDAPSDNADMIGRYKDGDLESGSDWVDWLPSMYLGNQTGPCFRLFTAAIRNNNNLLSSVRVPDIAERMPNGHESFSIGSVPVLDAFLQLCILQAGNVTDFMGNLYPTYVKEFSFSLEIPQQAGDMLWTQSHTAMLSQRDTEGSCMVVAPDGTGEVLPVARMTGTRFFITERQASKSVGESSPGLNICTKVAWMPDTECLSQANAENIWGHGVMSLEEESSGALIEKAAWLCLQRAWEAEKIWNHADLPEYYQYFSDWLGTKYKIGKAGDLAYQAADWNNADGRAMEETLHAASDTSACGELIIKIGRNLPGILAQTTDPLSLMLEDGLLDKFYASSLNIERAHAKAARYMDLLGHKSPGQKILEIGGGTGAATAWILEALTHKNNKQHRFSSYTFTDISAGFFEKARVRFKEYGNALEYKTLNIEKEPESQGFLADYDVVIAANVLHATSCMDKTMQHVKALLRPGASLSLLRSQTLSLLVHTWSLDRSQAGGLVSDLLLSTTRGLTLCNRC